MTPDETVMLARYVRALCPQQKFDEYTADAWHDVLAPYTLTEARAAVARHITSGNVFVAVGEIVTEIRKGRRDILDRHSEAEPPAGDTGDHTYTAALQNERLAVATGITPPRPIAALPPGTSDQPTGRARAILAAVGNRVPTTREGIVNVLGVPCPRCHATPGRTCTTNGRRRADAHPSRLEDARRAAAGLPPADPADAARELDRRRDTSRAALPPGAPIPEPQDGFQHPTHQEATAS